MSKKKGNAADLAPSRKEKKGIGQYVLGFFLLLYTLFCFLPVLLVFIAAFTDEGALLNNGFSYFPHSPKHPRLLDRLNFTSLIAGTPPAAS